MRARMKGVASLLLLLTLGLFPLVVADVVKVPPGVGTFFSNWAFDRTITPIGTTGARTINQLAGTVNVAAAAGSVVVTDNLVNTSSIVFSTLRTADGTCTFVKSVVPAAGSFTVTLNANCTATTSVGFLVTN